MIQSINDFTDKQLADMIRKGCYTKGTGFADPSKDTRWLLVLAVPYGPSDEVTSLPQAYEAFTQLIAGDYAECWDETNIQVFDALDQSFGEYALEQLTPGKDEDDEDEHNPDENDHCDCSLCNEDHI